MNGITGVLPPDIVATRTAPKCNMMRLGHPSHCSLVMMMMMMIKNAGEEINAAGFGRTVEKDSSLCN